MTKIRELWQRLRWHFSAERAGQLDGARVHRRWLDETEPTGDTWDDERGEQR